MSFNTYSLDAYEKWRLGQLEERDARNDDLMASWEKTAATDTGRPECIAPGDLDHVSQMTWDYSQGWEERAYKTVREQLNHGYLKPGQFIDHGTHLESNYQSEIHMEPLQNGDACVRCHNSQTSFSYEDRKRRIKVLEDIGYVRPQGIDIRDLCAVCGSRLDTQKVA